MGECQLTLGSCKTIWDIEFDEGLEVVLAVGTGDGSSSADAEGGVGGVFADVDDCTGVNDLLNMISGDEVIGSLCRESSG